MKTTRANFGRLFALTLITSGAAACGGSGETPKTPEEQQEEELDDRTEKQADGAPEWKSSM